MPLHTLLADLIEGQGGSTLLVKILNRLGVCTSADTLIHSLSSLLITLISFIATVVFLKVLKTAVGMAPVYKLYSLSLHYRQFYLLDHYVKEQNEHHLYTLR
jgi:DNA invertase Pin-like site-specific DNA recombinase